MTRDFKPYPDTRPVKDRKTEFVKLNEFVTKRGGWITSIPGAAEVTIECLPGSTLPDELAAAGWRLKDAGKRDRLIPNHIEERFTIGAGGELNVLTAGSTRPLTLTKHHAGIAQVHRLSVKLNA